MHLGKTLQNLIIMLILASPLIGCSGGAGGGPQNAPPPENDPSINPKNDTTMSPSKKK